LGSDSRRAKGKKGKGKKGGKGICSLSESALETEKSQLYVPLSKIFASRKEKGKEREKREREILCSGLRCFLDPTGGTGDEQHLYCRPRRGGEKRERGGKKACATGQTQSERISGLEG